MTDASALRALAAALATVDVEEVCRPVMTKAGSNMRDRARAEAPSGPHLPDYARSITARKPTKLVSEVGANSTGQGPLSGILEYGSGANAPHPHILPQLEREAPATARWLGKVIKDALS